MYKKKESKLTISELTKLIRAMKPGAKKATPRKRTYSSWMVKSTPKTKRRK